MVHICTTIGAPSQAEEGDMVGRKVRPKVRRVGVYLTEEQIVRLRSVSDRAQIPVSTLIRNGVDRELEARGAKPKSGGGKQ
jgi:hypothetical protein